MVRVRQLFKFGQTQLLYNKKTRYLNKILGQASFFAGNKPWDSFISTRMITKDMQRPAQWIVEANQRLKKR